VIIGSLFGIDEYLYWASNWPWTERIKNKILLSRCCYVTLK